MPGIRGRGDGGELALEDRDVAVDGVALRLRVLILGGSRDRVVDRPVELVTPFDETVDRRSGPANAAATAGVDRPIGLVLEVRLGEGVGACGRVVRLAVGEEDVQHERVGRGLDAHPLQQLGMVRSHPSVSFAMMATGADLTRRASVSRLTSWSGRIRRAGRGGLDDDRGLGGVHRGLAEGVRTHQSREEARHDEDQPLASAQNRGVLAEIDHFFCRGRGGLHPSLHLCSILSGSRRGHLTMGLGAFQRTEGVIGGTQALGRARSGVRSRSETFGLPRGPSSDPGGPRDPYTWRTCRRCSPVGLARCRPFRVLRCRWRRRVGLSIMA